MIRKDIQNLFGESIENLIKSAEKKWDEAYDKIEKQRQYNEDCQKAKDTMSESINRINEILDVDLTTKEGYSRYMEYLADLRNRTQGYDGFLKAISGKTAAEIIDDIAQKATTFYEENKKEKQCPIGVTEDLNEFKKETTESSKDIIEPEYYDGDDECGDYGDCAFEEDVCANPSDMVSEQVLESINRIVDRYLDESLIPSYGKNISENDLDWLTDELVEFACWLNKQYPKK